MDAVCFDMDGVIVDSERHWATLEAEHIFPETVDGDVTPAEIAGMNVDDLYDYMAEHYEPTVSREGFIGAYDDAAETLYYERAALFPEFHALLDALREQGVGAALVSSSPHRWIAMVLDRFDLEGAFDAVVSVEDIDGPGKPAPDVYRHATAQVGVDSEDCVAVEDSTHGTAAAVDAGLTCYGYTGASDEPADLTRADAVAADPGELRALLGV
jgi:HAD superfamily hydrolase (TIGR01509 family)